MRKQCKHCKAPNFSYDKRPPHWQYIVIRQGECIKCSPHLFRGKESKCKQLTLF